MQIIDYEDSDGYPRRVQLPNGGSDPEKGIPISADWEALALPEKIRVRLAVELAERGLMEPADFRKSGAVQQVLGAWQRVLGVDTNTILRVLGNKN